MCWCDITAAERGSRKPFIWAGKCVRVRDRQQFPGVPKEWVLASSHPFILSFFFFSTLLGLSFSLTLSTPFLPLSHSALFPFNQIQAKTRRAIYRRVVLFYQPVSICGTQMYRGLPGCWRQQCSAAANWRLCETERKTPNDNVRQKEDRTELEDAWHLVVGRVFALSLSGEMWRFISVCKMQVQNERTICVPVSHYLI